MVSILDPEHIRVCSHAIERYRERRSGWADPWQVEVRIRDLLGRVCHRTPPIVVRAGNAPARRWVVGRWVFITNPDCTAVLTCYEQQTKPAKRAREQRKLSRERRWL